MIKVTVWNEFYHETTKEKIRAIYPEGIHNTIADFLRCDDISVRTATLDMPECGLTKEVLEDTDVLIWWGHAKHNDVPDEIAFRVQREVNRGMGVIFLHSAHLSKPFRFLMGTPCNLCWRESDDFERLWVIEPNHPIAKGLGRFVEIPADETYGEPFGIPTPDHIVFMGWYSGGEVFRSGVTYERHCGKIFYFQPGHESYPIYHQAEVQTIIRNAVRWAAPENERISLACPHVNLPTDPNGYLAVK